MKRLKVMSVFGTRPEAIKMAPIVLALEADQDRFLSRTCATSQQRQMQDQALAVFGIRPDHDLDLMRPGQSLNHVVGRVLEGMGDLLDAERPDYVLVQGDTSTAFAAALAAFHARIPVGHVEAGLRTNEKYAPFPEEINRKMLSSIAELHFAPTEYARQTLLTEGYPDDRILVTGNSIIDALRWVLDHTAAQPAALDLLPTDGAVILVTGHRRESFGAGFEQICLGLKALADGNPKHHIVYPVHLNPRVQEPVLALLGGLPNVHLLDPLPYVSFVRLMQRAAFIISDSGGIQEEATALGKPVLVMRSVTERPEGVLAGVTRLVGTDASTIVTEAQRLIDDPAPIEQVDRARTLYGDGRTASRILDALASEVGGLALGGHGL